MKQRNAPANKGKQLVSFTHQDAQRINAAVASHENARRARSASSLPRAAGGGGGGVRQAEFVGSWLKGQAKIVLLVGQSTATAYCDNSIVDVLYSDAPRTCFVVSATAGDRFSLLIPECIR